MTRESTFDIGAVLRERAAAHPDHPLFRFLTTGDVDGGVTTWTCAELDRRARRIAVRLREVAAPGDRALMIFPPDLDFIAAFFGCIYAGVVAVPAYPPDPARIAQTLPRLRAIAADAGATVLLTTAEIAQLAEPLGQMAPDLGALRWLAVDALPAGSEALFAPAAAQNPLAFLQYTSGSTGDAKGVMVSHANLGANLAMMARGARIATGARAVGWVPLFHDLGLVGNVLQTVNVRGEMVLLSPLAFLKQPLRWLRAISHFRAAISGGPDFAYDLCARKVTERDLAGLDLRCWQLAFSSAEPVRAATCRRFSDAFAPAGFSASAIRPAYGLAEATLAVTVKPADEAYVTRAVDSAALARGVVRDVEEGAAGAQVVVSSGQAVEGCTVLVVDPERAVPVADGVVGEVWLRGEHIAQGYWGRPDLSSETFGARLAGDDAGPFLRTGDLGFRQAGELFIAGRRKDLIIVRGTNHYPQDLERTAEAAHAALRPGCSAAFAVERDGRELVVLVAEAEGEPAALVNVATAVREAVLSQHQIALDDVVLLRPRTVFKTSSGKIQRYACRAAYVAATLERAVVADAPTPPPSVIPPPLASVPDAQARSADDVLAFLLGLLKKAPGMRADAVRGGQTATSLGLDSLTSVQLAGELEQYLGSPVPVEVFFGQTLAQVAQQLAAGVRAVAAVAPLDLGAELVLDPALVPAGPPAPAGGALFLTGATGFLGATLLAELLERTTATVHCLVRASTAAEGHTRLRDALRDADRWDERHAARIVPVPGDLALPRFGLAPGDFATLAGSLSAIYHCGATIHWARGYHDLAPANVGGTRAVVALAASHNVPIHFVSSLGVYPLGVSDAAWFPEEGEIAGGERLQIGYFQSKWVAERVLDLARRRGFSVTVYRPGFITGDSKTGRDSATEAQLFYAFLAGAIGLGSVPRLDKVLDVVPVDFVAAAVASLSLLPAARGRSFNLLNPAPLRQRDCYAHLRAMGYALREVAYPAWREAVLQLPRSQPDNALARFAPYYRVLSEPRMQRLEKQTAARMPMADDNARALLPADVRCAPFDAALLETYVRAYVARGLLPAPRAAATPVADARAVDFVSRYELDDDRVVKLYDRAKQKQWDAAQRIDWRLDLDPENPQELPDTALPLYGSALFDRMDRAEKAKLRRHFQAWQLAQFMHGEQGALLCASKIVQQAPTLDAKLYAATQVVDEARHLEAFARLLRDKFELSYPVAPPLKSLLDDVLSDSRWDMTFLGMQVLIEGLALAAFALIRDQSKNKLAASVNAYVMEDEARHVAFGRITLARYYPTLTERERDEREAFVAEASFLLRDRFQAEQVWEALGLPVDACLAHLEGSGFLRTYRAELFSRIVPTIKAIGLWGPRVRSAYASMGVLGFAHVDVDALSAHDERVARQFDAELRTTAAIGDAE